MVPADPQLVALGLRRGVKSLPETSTCMSLPSRLMLTNIYSLNTGLFFLYADDTTQPVNDSVCIAHVSRRCQWLGFGISSLTVKALISKVGKVDCACNNKVLPPYSWTRVRALKGDGVMVCRQLCGAQSHSFHLPRSHLDPVDILAIDDNRS